MEEEQLLQTANKLSRVISKVPSAKLQKKLYKLMEKHLLGKVEWIEVKLF